MKLIIMRHGESANNVLSKLDRDLYLKTRTPEPELSPKGEEDCTNIGLWLAE